MTEQNFIDRYGIPWFALGLTAISFTIVAYLKAVFIFDDSLIPQLLASVAEYASLFGLILGLFSIGRWQGIIGVLLANITLYFIHFGPLWAIS